MLTFIYILDGILYNYGILYKLFTLAVALKECWVPHESFSSVELKEGLKPKPHAYSA